MRLIFIIITFWTSFLYSQNSNFTIFTFEYEFESRKSTNYWIVENDSIGDYSKLELKQVFIDIDYSKTILNKCSNGEDVDITNDVFSIENNLDFSSSDLIKKLKRNRRFLQKVTHKYGSGIKSKLKVYSTPISGQFSLCKSMNLQPKGIIIEKVETYIPKSLFSINESFYNSTKWKRLKYYDFSEFLHESFH